jgi:hypothetical protein
MSSLHRFQVMLKGVVMLSVPLLSLFIGGPAKQCRLWLTAHRSVYVHLVLLLGEAQHGTLCRVQVQQTLHSCVVVYKCNILYAVVS